MAGAFTVRCPEAFDNLGLSVFSGYILIDYTFIVATGKVFNENYSPSPQQVIYMPV
jgi:hypothetical protein